MEEQKSGEVKLKKKEKEKKEEHGKNKYTVIVNVNEVSTPIKRNCQTKFKKMN